VVERRGHEVVERGEQEVVERGDRKWLRGEQEVV